MNRNDRYRGYIHHSGRYSYLSEVGHTADQRRGNVVSAPHAHLQDMGRDLDDIDRSILYLLQKDARGTTAEAMADRVGVSASTIRNRIDRLEDDDIIKGYHPEIDYEAANLPLQVTFVISVPPTDLQDYSEQIRGIQGVIDVREMLTGRRNVHVDVVGTSSSDITRITDATHDIGVEIESSEMMRQRYVQPFNHFFLQGTGEADARDNTSDE